MESWTVLSVCDNKYFLNKTYFWTFMEFIGAGGCALLCISLTCSVSLNNDLHQSGQGCFSRLFVILNILEWIHSSESPFCVKTESDCDYNPQHICINNQCQEERNQHTV